MLAAGLLCYAAWRFVQAAAGAEGASSQGSGSQRTRDGGRGSRTGEDRRLGLRTSTWKRIGWFASGAAYLVLFAEAIDIIIGSSSSGGPGEHPQPVVATILHAPVGAGVIGLAGAGIAAGGIALGVWGAVHRYDRVLHAEAMSERSRTWRERPASPATWLGACRSCSSPPTSSWRRRPTTRAGHGQSTRRCSRSSASRGTRGARAALGRDARLCRVQPVRGALPPALRPAGTRARRLGGRAARAEAPRPQ